MEPSIALARTTNDHLSHAASERLFKLMIMDFTAVLLGYNLPRDDARQAASKATESVREHFVATGATPRRVRL
jgi:hypothetical protein